MSRRLIIVILCLLLLVALYLFVIFIRRPVIRIYNNGNTSLFEVECYMKSDNMFWTKEVGVIKSGQYIDIPKLAADLYLLSIAFDLRGQRNHIILDLPGLATPHEIYEIEIDNDANVSGSYIH